MSTTELRAAKTSTSAGQTAAAATSNANAPTCLQPTSVKIAKLATATKGRRAANATTRARKTILRTRVRITTAAATLNAHASTTGEKLNVTIAQLAMSTTERKAANLFAELSTRYATNQIPRSGCGSPIPTPSKSAYSCARMTHIARASHTTPTGDAACGRLCAGTRSLEKTLFRRMSKENH